MSQVTDSVRVQSFGEGHHQRWDDSPFARSERSTAVMTEHRTADIIANSATHGVGAVLALGGAVVLMVAAAHGTTWQVASCSVFGCTLALVYVCSTLYHSLVRTRARHVLRIIDHSAIYLLIAGTYTPFVLVPLHGQFGMASVRNCVEPGRHGDCVQEFCRRPFRHRVGLGISGHGLARRVCDAPSTARTHVARRILDCAGRAVLYSGYNLLRF